MKITIKLFAYFREGRQKIIESEFPAGTTPLDIIKALGIKKEEIAILLINGRDGEIEGELNEGDLISLFPPVGGG